MHDFPVRFLALVFLLAACNRDDVPSKKDPLDNGLITYYPFNGNALDESGNNHHTTVHNAVLAPDRFGKAAKAFHFDGQSSFIRIPRLSKADSLREFTLSAWVKPETAGNMTFLSLYAKNDWVSCANWLGMHHLNGNFQVYHQFVYSLKANVCTSTTVQGAIPNPVNQWKHLVVVQRYKTDNPFVPANVYASYVDGTRMQDGGASNPMASSFKYGGVIGCTNTSGNDQFNFNFARGSIDDVRIYNRALSDEEVKQLYRLDH